MDNNLIKNSTKIEKDWRVNSDNKFDNERVRFVDYLNLNLDGKNVLEMSAGALGTLTKYLLNKNANLTITDGREENIQFNMKKNNIQEIDYKIVDYDKDYSIDKPYDVIFCFGLLYHLSNIENVVKNIGHNCRDYAIISTCVRRDDNPSNTYTDDTDNYTQALNGVGISFSRETLKKELEKYFRYVCVPYHLPNDPHHYPLKWPVEKGRLFKRQIFLATNNKNFIDENKFSYDLLNEYKYLE